MNTQVLTFEQTKTGKQRTSYYGFSWTAMFFTPIVQLIRKDLRGFILFFVIYYFYGNFMFPYLLTQYSEYLAYLSQVLLWVFCGLSYNKIHILLLLNSGYLPLHSQDAQFLRDKGFYVKKKGYA